MTFAGENVIELDGLLAQCWVPGDPVPQGSLNPIKHPYTGKIVTFQSKRLKVWRRAIHLIAKQKTRAPRAGPVCIWLNFMVQATKAELKQGIFTLESAAKVPDVDKLARGVLDALSGVYFLDDAQVIDLVAKKRRGADPGVMITMYSVGE